MDAVTPVVLFDRDDRDTIEQYLFANGLTAPCESPLHVARAGSGNMNLTLRVTTRDGSMILKQGRPWVERYPHIAAPWDRTLIEGHFYQAVGVHSVVAAHLPALLHFDEGNHVLVLEDLGPSKDYTTLYATGDIASTHVESLLNWLERLSEVRVADSKTAVFRNRAMRELNHEHIFRLPLVEGNGLDLDAVTVGLARVALELKRHGSYCAAVRALGLSYLGDGQHLVHGDYFPGSWLASRDGTAQARGGEAYPAVRIIDPEFCFLGAREFDYGVMLAHLALGRCDRACGKAVLAAASAAQLDDRLVLGFAGVEIMRRLIGVAQLPLPYGLDVKSRLLALSAHLVLARDRSLDWW